MHRNKIRAAALVVSIVAAATPTISCALNFDTGVQGLSTDLTVDLRYALGIRTEAKDPRVADSILFDVSDNKFNQWSVVEDRIDARPQLQVEFSPGNGIIQSVGARVSGNLFKDFAYTSTRAACRSGYVPAGLPPGVLGPDNPGLPFTGALSGLAGRPLSYCDPSVTGYTETNGYYSAETKYRDVRNIELQDAFVFGNFEIDGAQMALRVGSHALFWGESIFNPYYGVSYAQGPINLNSALTIPAIRAQDLFVPVNQVSGTFTPNATFTFGFQYFLPYYGWRRLQAPEGGTYLGPFDALVNGPDSFFLANLGVLGAYSLKREADNSGTNHNDFGLYSKANLTFPFDVQIGAFYRQFDETLPWLNLTTANQQNQPALIAALPQIQQLLGSLGIDVGTVALPGGYHLRYPTETRLLGLTMSTQQFGISFGADVAYSPNRALNSQLLYTAPFGTTDDGQRARGETLSGVLNGLYVGPSETLLGMKLWDATTTIFELNWSYLMKITEGQQFYKGVHTTACKDDAALEGAPGVSGETVDGCSSRYNLGMGGLFQPSWFQVFPGVDLNATLFATYGFKNTSPLNLTEFEGNVVSSAGVGATFYEKVTASIDFHHYSTTFRTGKNLAGEEVATSFNFLGNISDRDWVSLSLGYSF